jgi:uncharacterized protein
MRFLGQYLHSPVAARVAPLAFFVLVTAAQGSFFPNSTYWFYCAKTLVGLWLIWEMWPLVAELRWQFSWPAVFVGTGIFGVWVGVSGEWTTQHSLWAKLGLGQAANHSAPDWNPRMAFSNRPALAWFFIAVRILGSTLVVPPLEEVFYRSFLYRYLVRHEFFSVPLNKFFPVPFFVTAFIFGISHNEWFAGIICGLAYQWLVLRGNRLGEALTAHATTNLLLGLWVVTRGAWQFW